MLRTLLLIGAFLVITGIIRADEFTGSLTKVHENKLTFTRGTGKKKKTFTLVVSDNCLVVVAKYDAKTKKITAGDTIAGGLKNPLFDKLETDTVGAWIRTDAANEKILELRLFQLAVNKKKVK